MATMLSAAQAHGLGGALLLDVRTPGEFRAAHVAGSISQPLDHLDPASLQTLLTPGRACVVLCQSGNRARKAAERLKAAGLSGIFVVEGGLQAWQAAGLPVEKGAGVLSLERQVRIGAGLLVLTGIALGTWVHPGFYGLSAFVGAGLVFAGITDWCGMGLLLARMPWNR